MKNTLLYLFLIASLAMLSGCTTFPVTYSGDGTYQQLQEDRFECLKQATGGERTAIYGSSNSSGAVISGNTTQNCDGNLWRSCLASEGWKREYDGSGVEVATIVVCNGGRFRQEMGSPT